MASAAHTESAFELDFLVKGYVSVDKAGFDRERALFPEVSVTLIRETQPKEWGKLEVLHGAQTGELVLADLCKWMDVHGCLATLRHGFKCYGRTLRVAFFKAAHGVNPELETRYKANRVGITRQLEYSTRNANKLDVTISLNGVPVATAELKNPLTGQTFEDAKRPYCFDRNPREVIFEFKPKLRQSAGDPTAMNTALDAAFQNSVAHWLAGEVYRRHGGARAGAMKYPPAPKPGPTPWQHSKRAAS